MPKKTFEAVKKVKGELIVQLKENQPELYREVSEGCTILKAVSINVAGIEKARNRIEHREARVFDVSSCLIESAKWKEHVACAIEVKRRTKVLDTKNKCWVLREEVAYYLASHWHDADYFARLIREHWRCENVHHYVRDVAMREDASRIRTAPGVFARLRSFALNILRANNVTNIKQALFENALAFDILLAYRGIT